jgi:lysophospholipid acyltransferase 1/2
MLLYVVLVAVSYVVMILISPTVVHLYLFAITMGWLSIVHIYRVSVDVGDTNYYNDVSGSLMVLTQRLSSLGFCIYDGMGRKKDDLTSEQKEQCVGRLPTLLEFLSYSFNFPGIMLGPLCFYNDYVAFIEGKHSQAKDNVGVIRETNGLVSLAIGSHCSHGTKKEKNRALYIITNRQSD